MFFIYKNALEMIFIIVMITYLHDNELFLHKY